MILSTWRIRIRNSGEQQFFLLLVGFLFLAQMDPSATYYVDCTTDIPAGFGDIGTVSGIWRGGVWKHCRKGDYMKIAKVLAPEGRAK